LQHHAAAPDTCGRGSPRHQIERRPNEVVIVPPQAAPDFVREWT
jgi:hypothetical protein